MLVRDEGGGGGVDNFAEQVRDRWTKSICRRPLAGYGNSSDNDFAAHLLSLEYRRRYVLFKSYTFRVSFYISLHFTMNFTMFI